MDSLLSGGVVRVLFDAEKRSEASREQDNGSQILGWLWMAVAGDGGFPEGAWEEWMPVTLGEKIP